MQYKLKYLLTVETADKVIKQTSDDISTTGGGSFYYDIKDLVITKATLSGKGKVISIDLTDGDIEINGVTVLSPYDIPPQTQLRLIYYRKVQQRTSFNVNSGVFGKRYDLEPLVRYFIGFQYLFRGHNYEWQIGVE